MTPFLTYIDPKKLKKKNLIFLLLQKQRRRTATQKRKRTYNSSSQMNTFSTNITHKKDPIFHLFLTTFHGHNHINHSPLKKSNKNPIFHLLFATFHEHNRQQERKQPNRAKHEKRKHTYWKESNSLVHCNGFLFFYGSAGDISA